MMLTDEELEVQGCLLGKSSEATIFSSFLLSACYRSFHLGANNQEGSLNELTSLARQHVPKEPSQAKVTPSNYCACSAVWR